MFGALPQRGSTRSSDAAYDPWLARVGSRLMIGVNGRPVSDVIAYDCREGWVRRLQVSNSGRICIREGKVAEHVLRGIVTVDWR